MVLYGFHHFPMVFAWFFPMVSLHLVAFFLDDDPCKKPATGRVPIARAAWWTTMRCHGSLSMESDFKTPVKNRCFFGGETLNMIEASPFFGKTMPFLLERKTGELPNWFWPIKSWLNKFISWISQYVDQENRQLTINPITHGLPVVYWWFGDDHYCWTNFESFDFQGNI